MPLTTGGITSGRRTSARSTACPRKEVRARTIAIGTPSRTQRTVLVALVRTLSQNASLAESDPTSEPKSPQSTRPTIARSGSSTNTAPSSAGT